MKNLIIVGCLALAGTAWAAQRSEAPLTVAMSALCLGIVDREPEDVREEPVEFAEGTEKVYFWTVARTGTPPARLRHIWYVDGRQTAVVSLTVRHERTRTWSSKNVWPGAWKVDAVADDGSKLATAKFTVK